MRVSLALLVLPLALARATNPAQQRRHHARVIERQAVDNGTDTGDVDTTSDVVPTSTPPTRSSTAVVPTSSENEVSVSSSSSTVRQPPTSSSIVDDVVSTSAPPVSSSAVVSSSSEPLSATPTSNVVASSSANTASVASSAGVSKSNPSAITRTAGKPSVVVSRTTSSASATSGAANADPKSTGLSKPALIAIIVVAVVVGLVIIGWTLFRKFKLRPSNRFDQRMQPIDFSPNQMGDDFLEKTLHRSASVSSADRQRREFVADLDKDNLTSGVPDHDFTAGMAGAGGYGAYNADPYQHDPYARADAYDFSTPRAEYDFPQAPEPAATYPPQQATFYNDFPTQDPVQDSMPDGYNNLQRGPSVGHTGVGAAGYQPNYDHQPNYDQPSYGHQNFDPLAGSEFEIGGRPTGGLEGPYAQAATYRY